MPIRNARSDRLIKPSCELLCNLGTTPAAAINKAFEPTAYASMAWNATGFGETNPAIEAARFRLLMT